MKRKEAFEIVFEELTKCNLFRGTYDAQNGNEHFMHGVGCVMESIAYGISDIVGDNFSDSFTANLIASEKNQNKVDK